MHQSRTLDVGMAVHQESLAVAYAANAHHTEVSYLRSIGTRQSDLDKLVRQRA